MTKKANEKEKTEKDEPKLCPNCKMRLNWFEAEDGSFRLWCYNCQAPFLAQIK